MSCAGSRGACKHSHVRGNRRSRARTWAASSSSCRFSVSFIIFSPSSFCFLPRRAILLFTSASSRLCRCSICPRDSVRVPSSCASSAISRAAEKLSRRSRRKPSTVLTDPQENTLRLPAFTLLDESSCGLSRDSSDSVCTDASAAAGRRSDAHPRGYPLVCSCKCSC